MLFRRIAIRNFRKHLSPMVIDDLGEGVTVIVGDNEEGKSTLLDAIRTGLFERHNLGGKAADAMQPFGSTVRPEVRLDFEIDGSSYSITKGFVQKASARLTTPAGTFEGAAAEERLAELLTFRLSQRGESASEEAASAAARIAVTRSARDIGVVGVHTDSSTKGSAVPDQILRRKVACPKHLQLDTVRSTLPSTDVRCSSWGRMTIPSLSAASCTSKLACRCGSSVTAWVTICGPVLKPRCAN